MIFQDHNGIKSKRCPVLLELIFDRVTAVSTVKSRNFELSPSVIVFFLFAARLTAGTNSTAYFSITICVLRSA